MPRYCYQVRNSSGQTEAGTVSASNEMEASRLLRKDGKIIISLREESAPPPASEQEPLRRGRRRIKKDDVIFFATQLAVMVDTGVPLPEALDSIAGQTESQGMAEVIEQVAEDIKGGQEFSAAMAKYPRVFDRVFVALMRASEASGTMGTMLQRVSEYMEQERDTRKKVAGAMTYPACMLGFCVMVVTGLLIFVLPRFEKIYAGKGAALPLPTRLLLGLSNGILSYWYVIVTALAVVGGLAWYYFRTPAGRIFLDWARINLPIIGPMCRKAYLARSLRTMATMISTGVNMLDGLAITSEAAGNHYFSQIWQRLSKRVTAGSSLAEHLFTCPLIPRSVSQMVSAGERTGKLSLVMNRVAAFCEGDLQVAVKTVTNMIEPIMIIVMGLLVGGIAMALLLPIFSISKVVAH